MIITIDHFYCYNSLIKLNYCIYYFHLYNEIQNNDLILIIYQYIKEWVDYMEKLLLNSIVNEERIDNRVYIW